MKLNRMLQQVCLVTGMVYQMNCNDWKLVSDDVDKYHPFTLQQDQLCNIVTGQIAPTHVNVAKALTKH